MSTIKLTEFSHGAGCGCKIAPAILDKILKTDQPIFSDPKLLVGNADKDDAAAYDLGNGTSVLSTTDFFMPIVDDPFTFGRIAATNALSDIYAMGGKPLMAIAILGWPIHDIDPEVAKVVVDGGRKACMDAGIPLAGGHSIDSPEPIFGLCVTGIIDNDKIKQNNMATPDCDIYLTKPLGIGILSTAQKRKKIEEGHIGPAIEAMCTINKFGQAASAFEGVTAITDVTGFGLMGHLGEICIGSDISAVIEYEKVPFLPNTKKYYDLDCIPGGTRNNFKSYEDTIGPMTKEQEILLCDAQTSGGLLILVKKDASEDFKTFAKDNGLDLEPIGYTTQPKEKRIYVNA